MNDYSSTGNSGGLLKNLYSPTKKALDKKKESIQNQMSEDKPKEKKDVKPRPKK